MTFKTEQEAFWAGEFGTEYIQRNRDDALLASNLAFFGRIIHATNEIASCIEFGANIGMNLRAIQLLRPDIDMHGIEINVEACKQLSEITGKNQAYNMSILDFSPSREWDLTLIKGVLIHQHPDELPLVYDKLVTSCGRYCLVAEYYNPTPTSIPYRGHSDRLFKRDFCGEIMDRHPQMKLIDYGFVYRRDPNFPQDDITYFLMEKKV